jgi:hypothetical protein
VVPEAGDKNQIASLLRADIDGVALRDHASTQRVCCVRRISSIEHLSYMYM